MLRSILPIDIGPGCQLLVCGRQTVTQLPSHSHARLAKTAEVHFQSKYHHSVKGIINRNFSHVTAAVIGQHSISTINYWHVTVPFRQVYKIPGLRREYL